MINRIGHGTLLCGIWNTTGDFSSFGFRSILLPSFDIFLIKKSFIHFEIVSRDAKNDINHLKRKIKDNGHIYVTPDGEEHIDSIVKIFGVVD